MPRRHEGADRIGGRDDLRDRQLQVHIRLEIDLLDDDPGQGLGLHVLDAVDRRTDGILAVGCDSRLHLVGRQARVLPDDADHRDADLWEDVGRRRLDRADAQKQDQDRDNIESVREAERELDDAHGSAPPGIAADCGNRGGRIITLESLVQRRMAQQQALVKRTEEDIHRHVVVDICAVDAGLDRSLDRFARGSAARTEQVLAIGFGDLGIGLGPDRSVTQ